MVAARGDGMRCGWTISMSATAGSSCQRSRMPRLSVTGQVRPLTVAVAVVAFGSRRTFTDNRRPRSCRCSMAAFGQPSGSAGMISTPSAVGRMPSITSTSMIAGMDVQM